MNFKNVQFKDWTPVHTFSLIVWYCSVMMIMIGITLLRVDLITLALVMNLYSNQEA